MKYAFLFVFLSLYVFCNAQTKIQGIPCSPKEGDYFLTTLTTYELVMSPYTGKCNNILYTESAQINFQSDIFIKIFKAVDARTFCSEEMFEGEPGHEGINMDNVIVLDCINCVGYCHIELYKQP